MPGTCGACPRRRPRRFSRRISFDAISSPSSSACRRSPVSASARSSTSSPTGCRRASRSSRRLGVPRMRHRDPSLRQRPGDLLAGAARPLPRRATPRSRPAIRSLRRRPARCSPPSCSPPTLTRRCGSTSASSRRSSRSPASISSTGSSPTGSSLSSRCSRSRSRRSWRPVELPARLIAAAAGGGILAAVALAYPKGMGMGDAKLVAVMGLVLGSALAPARVRRARSPARSSASRSSPGAGSPLGRKSAIPFGPFLALGGLVGLFAGQAIVHGYLKAVGL